MPHSQARPLIDDAGSPWAVVLAAAAELLLIYLLLDGLLGLSSILLLHGVIVLALAGYWYVRRADPSRSAIALMIIALAGPAGALAAAASLPFAARRESEDVLRAWYQRLADAGGADPVTDLYDHVEAGRTLAGGTRTPDDFIHVLDHGTLEEKQAALGLMAREFKAGYAPALNHALRSAEPVVRVQAAAVVARVRETLKERITAALAEPQVGIPTAAQSFARARELDDLAACALVDASERAQCQARVRETALNGLRQLGSLTEAVAPRYAAHAGLAQRALLDAGLFAEFRVLGRLQAIAAVPGSLYRVRRLPQQGRT